jgi:hypothetical protein
VDRHRVDGLDRFEPARADRRDLARPLEGRAQPAVLAGHDDAGVAVVEPQPVVVLRHQQRPPGVPALAAAADSRAEPALDPRHPLGDAVLAAAVRAQEAERAQRTQRLAGVAGGGRLVDRSGGHHGSLADGPRRVVRLAQPRDAVGRRVEDLDRRVGVAAAHGGGQLGDAAAEPVDAVEDDDPLAAGRADDVAEHGAGLDRRQLPGVADQHEPCLRPDGLDQPRHLRERHHRGLVDDHDVVREPVAAVVPEPAVAPGPPAEQPVQRRGRQRQQRGAHAGCRV